MAQVRPDTELQAWIDDYLAHLLSEWADNPVVADGWDEWEEHERLDFVLEWPIRENRLHQLRQWAAEGRLTMPQQRQYDDLMMLESRNRSKLERLLTD
jgi:hypothetical protein